MRYELFLATNMKMSVELMCDLFKSGDLKDLVLVCADNQLCVVQAPPSHGRPENVVTDGSESEFAGEEYAQGSAVHEVDQAAQAGHAEAITTDTLLHRVDAALNSNITLASKLQRIIEHVRSHCPHDLVHMQRSTSEQTPSATFWCRSSAESEKMTALCQPSKRRSLLTVTLGDQPLHCSSPGRCAIHLRLLSSGRPPADSSAQLANPPHQSAASGAEAALHPLQIKMLAPSPGSSGATLLRHARRRRGRLLRSCS